MNISKKNGMVNFILVAFYFRLSESNIVPDSKYRSKLFDFT